MSRWGRERSHRPWLNHLVVAYQRYQETNGNHLAAAITYFSFLALFPLTLLGVSAAAFVLANHPDLLEKLLTNVSENIPGSLGESINNLINVTLQRKGTVGLIGLLGVAYAGLGWVGNLRTGLQMVWSCEKVHENLIKAKLKDLLVLVGLGLGIVVSVTLTAGGTAAADALIRWLGLEGTPGLGTASAVLGILLAIVADTLIFMWLFVELPRRPVRYRSVLRGAIFAAVGYEILKIIGTIYLSRVGGNGAYGVFAGAVGLLIWINVVSRFLLFSAAWTATEPHPPAGDAYPGIQEDTQEAAGTAGGTSRTADRRTLVGPTGGVVDAVDPAADSTRRQGADQRREHPGR